MSWFNDLFINEAKPALNGRPSSGGSSEGGESSGGNSGPCSWNDLKDKPFGESVTEGIITFDGDLTGKETIEALNGLWVKMSDISLSPENLIGSTLTCVSNWGDMSTKIDEFVTKEALTDSNIQKIDVTDNAYMVLVYSITENSQDIILLSVRGDISSLGVVVPEGTYFAYISFDELYKYPVSISCLTGPVASTNPIDEKFIPETIARTSEVVPAPTTASVGQTVVVKAVDENGKPTEWAAADMGVGEGGAAIIDVVELPTENIQEDAFYRLLTGTFVIDQSTLNGSTCYCVDGLPEVGEPATSDMVNITAYYNVQDGSVNAYMNADLSAMTGLSVGWYPAEMMLAYFEVSWGGVIYDIMDDPSDSTMRFLLEYELYSYKGKWVSQKSIGRPGSGSSAETFNHPSNVASGYCAHAEGLNTTASGSDSHAEGYGTHAEGIRSHAEGSRSHAEGHYSHAEGSDTTASGGNSHAEGDNTTASGYCAHAEGNNTTASGGNSHAEGNNTTASGGNSHAEGNITTASGASSHAEGTRSHAEGSRSHAEGIRSHAEGEASHAEGYYSHAEGEASHAEGHYSHAEGYYSHAEGEASHAEGEASHAEGRGLYISRTITGAINATVYTINNADNLVIGASVRRYRSVDNISEYITAKIISIDIGNSTITVNRTLSDDVTLDNQSVNIYIAGIAFGDNSHSEGNQTIAAGRSQHTQGEFNIVDPEYDVTNNGIRGKYAHIVGNGTSNTDRSNAHTLDWEGNAWFAGDVYVGGTGQDDPNAKKLATEEYVNGHGGSGGSSAPSDWNAKEGEPGHVLNRTHWVERPFEPIVWDGNPEGKDTFDATALGLGVFCKISDMLLTKELAESLAVTGDYTRSDLNDPFALYYDDNISEMTQFDIFSVIWGSVETSSTACTLVSVAVSGDYTDTFGLVVPSAGLYAGPLDSETVSRIELNGDKFHKLDKRFLPDNLATIEQMEALITGAIGGSY